MPRTALQLFKLANDFRQQLSPKKKSFVGPLLGGTAALGGLAWGADQLFNKGQGTGYLLNKAVDLRESAFGKFPFLRPEGMRRSQLKSMLSGVNPTNARMAQYSTAPTELGTAVQNTANATDLGAWAGSAVAKRLPWVKASPTAMGATSFVARAMPITGGGLSGVAQGSNPLTVDGWKYPQRTGTWMDKLNPALLLRSSQADPDAFNNNDLQTKAVLGGGYGTVNAALSTHPVGLVGSILSNAITNKAEEHVNHLAGQSNQTGNLADLLMTLQRAAKENRPEAKEYLRSLVAMQIEKMSKEPQYAELLQNKFPAILASLNRLQVK